MNVTASGDVVFGAAFASAAVTIANAATEIRLGATNSNVVSVIVDDIRVDSGSMPGPSGSDTTATPTTTATATATATSGPSPTPGGTTTTRVINYSYDGLQRLIGAVESPGSTFAYTYDLAGNRTDSGLTYNAANQITNAGYSYDAAGNLTNDGSAAYTYDALNRTTARGATTYTSNGDGVLVYDGTTRFTQDLASPLTQILQTTQGGATTQYLYGLDRLAFLSGSTRTWYGADALGSVRLTLSDAGVPSGSMTYDPWGAVETRSAAAFGFAGEWQDIPNGLINLRARWYSTALHEC